MKAVKPSVPALLQQALSHLQQGRQQPARDVLAQLLVAAPQHVDALQLMGALELQAAQFAAALQLFDRALAMQPDITPAHANRGHALKGLGRRDDALAAYDRALALDGAAADVHTLRGALLADLGRLDDALAAQDQALALQPARADAHNRRGMVLRRLKRPLDALAAYDRALVLNPALASVHSNRGNLLNDLRRHAEAVDAHRRAIDRAPQLAVYHVNLGASLYALGRFDEAIAAYRHGLALRPDAADAWSNLGNALSAVHRFDEALQALDRALALQPGFPEAHNNRALARLLTGDLPGGWADYEWRWRNPSLELGAPRLPQPRWSNGVNATGKTVLLTAEQGLGDTLQFVRYVPRVRASGARVVLQVQPALRGLLTGFPGVDAVVTPQDPLPAFDLQCPLMSLPFACGTRLDSVPATVPYLHADPARVAAWAQRLGPRTGGPRIGFVWSGNPNHRNDHNRSMPLAALAPALGGRRWISLQKNATPADRAWLAERGILQVGDDLLDFTDTAALVGALDGVVAVDTAVAHLAGAMGKPVWLLLPHAPDWRWLLNRGDSPWYTTLRLLRQPVAGDWASVVRQLATTLQSL